MKLIGGGELGYILRADKLKLNFMAYYIRMLDLTETSPFYHDEERTFVNYSLTNIDRQHMGLELAASYKLTKWMSLTSAMAFGRYTYIDRPKAKVSLDNNAEIVRQEEVFWKNYHVSNTPELAYTGGVNFSYDAFFMNISANYTARNWIDVNSVRRTSLGLDLVPDGDLKEEILDQEMYDNQFSLDLFAGYTWRLGNTFDKMKNSHTLVFNVGVNNLTNNEDFVAIGFENNRFDFEDKNVSKFQNRYFYGNGINYFANITYRF